MKLVWKCEYCITVDINKDKIEVHEIKCVFNPSNRHCFTCDNYYDYNDSQYCKIHYNGLPNKVGSSSYYFSVMEKKIPCKDWSNNEIRKEKLIKLKNKIYEN